jgi:hypothetical protein
VFASGGETFNRDAAAAGIVCPRSLASPAGSTIRDRRGETLRRLGRFLPENAAEMLRLSSKALKDIYLFFHPARSRKS